MLTVRLPGTRAELGVTPSSTDGGIVNDESLPGAMQVKKLAVPVSVVRSMLIEVPVIVTNESGAAPDQSIS